MGHHLSEYIYYIYPEYRGKGCLSPALLSDLFSLLLWKDLDSFEPSQRPPT